jgi:hypothetical protein
MATWTTAYVNDLPDSAFACPEQRKYPHHDASGKLDLPHLRAALSRVGDPSNEQCGKGHLESHAKAQGLGDRGSKAVLPIKAQLMDGDELTAWLEGRTPRRLLALPFGGPFPSSKAPLGVDLDGQWFSADTDIYGGYDVLRKNRERLIDFHHRADEAKLMGDVLIGKAILDDEPEEDGWWERTWLNLQKSHLARLKNFVHMGGQLFGSSEAIPASVKVNNDTGEILSWAYVRQTLSPTPANTYSVTRSIKASLDAAEFPVSDAMKALLTDIEQLKTELPQSFPVGGDVAVRDERLDSIAESLDETLGILRQR